MRTRAAALALVLVAACSGGVAPRPGRPFPGEVVPYSASFVTAERGWVLGAGDAERASVLRTADGGATWSVAGTLPVPVGAVRHVRFLTERVGWAYGTEAYVTRDGGASWRAVTFPDGRALLSVGLSGETVYALLGRGDAPIAYDAAFWSAPLGMETFTRLDADWSEAVRDDAVVAGGTLAFTDGSTMRVSTDRGVTWATRDPCERWGYPTGLAATEDELFFHCRRRVERSSDGGRTTQVVLEKLRDGRLAAASSSSLTIAHHRLHVVTGSAIRETGPPALATWDEPRFHPGGLGTVLRAAGATRTLFTSADAGATWTEVAVGGTARSLVAGGRSARPSEEPAPPGARWIVWRGVEVAVPEAWIPGTFDVCGAPQTDAVLLNDIPSGGDCALYPAKHIDVVGFFGAGIDIYEAGPDRPAVVSGIPALRVTGTNYLGQRGEGIVVPSLDAMVFVASEDRATIDRVLGSMRVRTGVDARGCVIRPESTYAAALPAREGARDRMVPGTPVEATVCRYDSGGWAQVSKVLGTAEAAALAATFNGLPSGFSPDDDFLAPRAVVVTFRYADGPDVVVHVHAWEERDRGATNGAVTGQVTEALEAAVRQHVGWKYTYEQNETR